MATATRHVLLSWGGPIQSSNRIERGYRRWALSAAMLVMFTASVSSTIASAAVPTVVADLGGFNVYGWVVTSYLLASSVGVPLAGKLSDVYGRRPLYLIGILLFSVGALLAAAAPTMGFLIAARAISGLGGGAMMTLSNASVGDIFSPRERGRWMGIVMGVFGLSAIIGPPLGGAITDGIGWRWVFVMPVPLAIAAFLISGVVMPRVHTQQHARPDFIGAMLLGGGLFGVLLGITWGGTTYPWQSPQVVVAIGGGAVLLAALAWHERRSPDAMLPLELFQTRAFVVGSSINFIYTGLMYIMLTLIPLYVQGVLVQSPHRSGLVLTPTLVSFSIAAVVTGQLASRTGRYRIQMVVGGILIVVGYWQMSRLSPSSTTHDIVLDQIIAGAGIGLTQPVISLVVQSAFPHSMLGTANSGRQLFSNLGSAVMVPLMTALVVTKFDSEFTRLAPQVINSDLIDGKLTPQSLLTPASQHAAQAFFQGHPNLYAGYLASIRRALSDGITEAFTVGIVLGAIALLLLVVYPKVELTTWDDDAEYAPARPVEAPSRA